MLNKLLRFVRSFDMIQPGETVVCAVSGGADSVAMTFALYLLKDKLGIRLEAAHFNHHLRDEESDRDEAFVREFCDRYDIPLHVGSAEVKPGKKGLEAAARDARYAFLGSLPGKIATAHTADDNAETVLMHLVRGTGLKGLGGITPVNGRIIRPMLMVTRQDVEDFLTEWCIRHIVDSSNDTDAFLRNRIRHHVMPLLKQENPKLAENLTAMALRLREDEECLSAQSERTDSIPSLREMHSALRSRCLEKFLKEGGVREPEESHISLAEALVFSDKPSARASFPGGVTIARNYDRLEVLQPEAGPEKVELPVPGEAVFGGVKVTASIASEDLCTTDAFTVHPVGRIFLRPRQSGDSLRLNGGTKSVKKLFIDRKIPASQRDRIPVAADEQGILGIYSIGANLDRMAGPQPGVTIRFERTDKEGET